MSTELHSQQDPVYSNAKREAILILILWALCGLFTVGYCYFFGYISHDSMSESLGPPVGELAASVSELKRDPETLTFPLGLGIPDWVFYGILIPWGLCIVFTVWFCLFYFEEDELSGDSDPSERSGQS